MEQWVSVCGNKAWRHLAGPVVAAAVLASAGPAWAQVAAPTPAAQPSPASSTLPGEAQRLPPAAAAQGALVQPDLDELVMRQAVLQATWPADMVRLADDYLRRHAQQDWAADAALIQQRAQRAAAALRRNDVQLFRSAFVQRSEEGQSAEDLRRAALGDPVAAVRRAHQVRQVEGASKQHVGWLQFAAALGSEQAAYELALHFRRAAQPMMASVYETRAIELGYVPLPALDHSRK